MEPPPPTRPSVKPTREPAPAPSTYCRTLSVVAAVSISGSLVGVGKRLGGGQPFAALQHALPVDFRQGFGLEQPRETGRLLAVQHPFGEAGQQLAAIAELGQHDL